MKPKIRLIVVAFLILALASVKTPSAYADGIASIVQGIGQTISSVFQIPAEMLSHSTQAFPLGLIAGTVGGTMKAVAGTVVGAANIARGAAPYAKYAVFAL